MKNLFKSLAAFQNEVPTIHEDTKGYNYTYSNLNSIFKVIKPLLKKHGLGFTQLLQGNCIQTIIFHIDSGETITSEVSIPQDVKLNSMNTFQVAGSAITYFRRYSLSAALGLITDKDIDAKGDEVKTVTKPTFTPDNFQKAKAAKATIEMIKKNYTISAAIEKEYLEYIK